MSTTKNRMYSLCLASLQKAERNKGLHSHHMAQRMAIWAEAASLSDQHYKAFEIFNRGVLLTCSELAMEMGISSGHASMILRALKNKGLVYGGGKTGAKYSINSFIRP